MKYLLLFFMPVFLLAQYAGYPKYGDYLTAVSDSTVSVQITNIADNGTDSLDATGSVNYSSLVDSTYWFYRAAGAPSWASYDSLLKFNGWQSTVTVAHGQSSNTTVYMGLAVKDTDGDTTAITTQAHTISAFDETGPTVPTWTATGVVNDSVRLVASGVSADAGDSMMVRSAVGLTAPSDSTGGTLEIDWMAYANLDTTLFVNGLSQPTTISYGLILKDSLQNVSSVGDSALVPHATAASGGTVFNFALNAAF